MRRFLLFRWFNDVSIAKKLYFTVGIMALLIGVELFALFFCLNTLSSVRAYVGGEGLWSKAQKDAVFHLYKYGVSRNEEDYQLFLDFMKVPIGDGKARKELMKAIPDPEVARQGFLEGRNHPDDIEGMIALFRNFSHVSYIARAISIWTQAEPLVMQLIPIGQGLRKEITSADPSEDVITNLLNLIGHLNQRLTIMEDEFSYTLGDASRWLESVVLKLLFLTALTVEVTGLLLAVSVSRNIQKGLAEIIRAANSFAKGVYNTRANVFSRDEIGVLAQSFNEMSEGLERSIAERERAEGRLRRTFALLDQHVNNTPLGVIEWEQDDAAGEPPRVHRWSGRAQSIFGWTEDEVVGRSAEELGLIHVGDAQRAADAGGDLAEGRYPYHSLSLRCHTKDRRVRHCQWYNSALRPEASGKLTILSLVEDVSDRVAALEDVYRLAHHDTLTGLPNRVRLHDRLGQALMWGRRHGHRVAVMMLDLDHFKDVNDALGHTIGDGLLQEVAARLGGRMRGSDTLARIGGDEFVLIQPDLIDRSGAEVIAQKLIDALTEPFFVLGNRLDIGASIGITVFPDDATEPDLLLRNADIALYRAKRGGRAQYRCYSPDMDMELKATRSLEAGLRHALEHDTLELFYQPLFALDDRCLHGVEALIRWPHPGGGYVLPARFIPVAELSGIIVPLGEWILRQACRQAQVWIDAGWHLRLAVNLSAVQLRQADFAAVMERILDESHLVASTLELEITENVFLDPSMVAITKTLHEVAEMGVQLAIDDFGTGYSSLAYLKHFPFDRIKIDRSFVHDIGAGGNADAIVKAIIALGRSLGKSVTAEGVETESQLAFLRRNRCDEVQGYLLAGPRPVGEIEQTLRHQLIN
jgi:diguanylate cyclase (GGDEF)-like protein/PAS domain S-box-containing protein